MPAHGRQGGHDQPRQRISDLFGELSVIAAVNPWLAIFSEARDFAQVLGAFENYKQEDHWPLKPVDKRYCRRAEAHARRVHGDAAFESAFADGQKMSLDEAFDLALKTVEELSLSVFTFNLTQNPTDRKSIFIPLAA